MTVAEKEINRCGERDPLLLDMETEEEMIDEVQICMAIEEVIGKPSMVIAERLLLIPELTRKQKDESVGEGIGEKQTRCRSKKKRCTGRTGNR